MVIWVVCIINIIIIRSIRKYNVKKVLLSIWYISYKCIVFQEKLIGWHADLESGWETLWEIRQEYRLRTED